MRIATLFLLIVLAHNLTAQIFRYDLDRLFLEWEVVENSYRGNAAFLSALSFKNTGGKPFPKGWSMYFNFARTITENLSSEVRIEHINGDLYRIVPSEAYREIPRDRTLRIEFISSDWAVNFTDAPSGCYFVWDNSPGTGIPVLNYSIKPSTEPRQYLRSPEDRIHFATPEWRFEQYEKTQDLDLQVLSKVFPTPKSYEAKSGVFMINLTTVIDADPAFERLAAYLSKEFAFMLGDRLLTEVKKQDTRNRIYLVKNDLPSGEYTLSVSSARIEIAASSGPGIFYGIQSLKTLIDPADLSTVKRFIPVPAVEVRDAPRFGYRAFSLDVARNFQTKEEIFKIIDLMALYKLNVFHFHFSDDEGWRVEIPGLPELTEIGAFRGHSADFKKYLMPSYGSGPDYLNPFGSGYYSRKEFIEILRYARDRYVKVIPEIETPGHARAAIVAMQARYERLMSDGKNELAGKYLLRDVNDQSKYKSVQGWTDNVMDVALPSVYVFIDKVVAELQAMYAEAGAPFDAVHMGGDEVPAGVWEQSPSCKTLIETDPRIDNTADLWYYFYDRVFEMLKNRGLSLYGWEEVVLRKTTINDLPTYIPNPDYVGRNIHVDVWNNVIGWGSEDLAYKLANAGHKVILSSSSHLYFDMPYYKAFDEPGYYWAGFIDVDKPFSFIPFDYFRNITEDRFGNLIDSDVFSGKERLTDYGRNNIVGIQGLIWSENMRGRDRLEYQLVPKLLGLAERAWAPEPAWATEQNYKKAEALYREAWSVFANVLGKRELPRLDHYQYGYHYRIPPVGIRKSDGAIHVNQQFPGFTIRYTTNGKEPTLKSERYEGPIKGKGLITIKAFNSTGRSGRSVIVRNE